MFNLNEIRGLADVPRLQARTRGTGIAQIFEARQTSFDDFHRHTSQVAQGLAASGVAPQSRIGFLGKNSDRYFELLFGAAKAQAVLVGVNWRLAPPEIEYILKDAECSIVFVGAEFYGVIDELLAQHPFITTIIAMDGGHPHWPAFDAWREAQAAIDPPSTRCCRCGPMTTCYSSTPVAPPAIPRACN